MDIKELLKRVRIEDVIGRYAKLEYKNDDNLKCCCCFHEEDTPSMLVQTSEQFFICFGCNTKGNVINFISRYHNISFEEAYNLLAQEVGLVPQHNLQIYKDVSTFYHSKINEPKAIEFCQNRTITQEMIEYYNLGYSGKVFDLYETFKEDKDKLLEAKLLNIQNKGTVAEIYPSYFSNRLMFPIVSQLGIISLGGRTTIDITPKYLNLPDSQFFSKHRSFYGLTPDCIKAIQELDYVIIVEGFIDVIRMQSSGYLNTVCCMGVSMSRDHVQALKRFTKSVLLVYDGDEAGQLAVKRNAKEMIKSGLIFKVKLLPEKEDPDSFLLKDGDIDSLEIYDGFDIIKAFYDKEEMFNIIKETTDYGIIDPRILSHYKINVDVYFKKQVKQIGKTTRVYKLDNWTHIALLCESYPNLQETLTPEEQQKVEDKRMDEEFFTMRLRNPYKKVNNPESLLLKLKNN